LSANAVVGWAKEVRDLYSEGGSDAEVAAHLNITIKEFHKQMADSRPFALLVEMGRTLSMAWWEKQARLNVKNKTFNTPLWVFSMKNKYGWADKVETTNNTEIMNYDVDSLRENISKEMAKFVKQYTPELTDAKRVIEGLGTNDSGD